MAVADYIDVNAVKGTGGNQTITLRPAVGNIGKLKFIRITVPAFSTSSIEIKPQTGPNIVMQTITAGASAVTYVLGNPEGINTKNDFELLFDYDNYIEIKLGVATHNYEYLWTEVG